MAQKYGMTQVGHCLSADWSVKIHGNTKEIKKSCHIWTNGREGIF